jgi:hypothetical protein
MSQVVQQRGGDIFIADVGSGSLTSRVIEKEELIVTFSVGPADVSSLSAEGLHFMHDSVGSGQTRVCDVIFGGVLLSESCMFHALQYKVR